MLHLTSLRKSLPVFAASRQFNYTKSVYLYLQNMSDFEVTNPEVNKIFEDGNFVVRRSGRNRSGVTADLVTGLELPLTL